MSHSAGGGRRREHAELKTACYRKLPQREEWKRSGHESLCLEGQEEGTCGTKNSMLPETAPEGGMGAERT